MVSEGFWRRWHLSKFLKEVSEAAMEICVESMFCMGGKGEAGWRPYLWPCEDKSGQQEEAWEGKKVLDES